MQLEFPYQIVTFLDKEPEANEPVYGGKNGWYPQLALKRRFKLNQINEEGLVKILKEFFNKIDVDIETGALVKPERMPVRVVDVTNQDQLKHLHLELIAALEENIISRYPERDGENYYPHITAEYSDKFVIPADEYINKKFALNNVWVLKDASGGDSQAYIKIK
jgi:hypothetical protein